MSETQKPRVEEQWSVVLLVIATGFVCLVAAMKYFIPIAVGLFLGVILYGANFEHSKSRSIVTYSTNILVFAFFLFLLFGLPTDLPGTFPGVLSFSQEYAHFGLKCVRFWNHYCPKSLPGLLIRSFSLLDATKYAWISLYTALFVSGGLFTAKLFLKQELVHSQKLQSFLLLLSRLYCCFSAWFLFFCLSNANQKRRRLFLSIAICFYATHHKFQRAGSLVNET